MCDGNLPASTLTTLFSIAASHGVPTFYEPTDVRFKLSTTLNFLITKVHLIVVNNLQYMFFHSG